MLVCVSRLFISPPVVFHHHNAHHDGTSWLGTKDQQESEEHCWDLGSESPPLLSITTASTGAASSYNAEAKLKSGTEIKELRASACLLQSDQSANFPPCQRVLVDLVWPKQTTAEVLGLGGIPCGARPLLWAEVHNQECRAVRPSSALHLLFYWLLADASK